MNARGSPADEMCLSLVSVLLALSMDCRTMSVLKESTCFIARPDGTKRPSCVLCPRELLSSETSSGDSARSSQKDLASRRVSESLLAAGGKVCSRWRELKGGGKAPCPLAYASRRWELSLRIRACGGKGPSKLGVTPRLGGKTPAP